MHLVRDQRLEYVTPNVAYHTFVLRYQHLQKGSVIEYIPCVIIVKIVVERKYIEILLQATNNDKK